MSSKRNQPEHNNSSDGEEVLKRSRSTLRTPPKDSLKNKEMEEIKIMLMEMNKEIKTEIKELKTEMKEENKEIRRDINDLKEEIKHNTEEIKNIKIEIERMKEEWTKEKQELKHTEDPKTLKEEMTNMLGNYLGVKINIKRSQKIGLQTCLIELEDEEEKATVLRNKHKLKNASHEKIWITEYLTKGERENESFKR
uniref:Uncharacterized protein PF11_0207-like n=1 Tax=Diabrotica virgifera virgifera TaxID=50390 RepID=A0A6P7GE85_DIAVI